MPFISNAVQSFLFLQNYNSVIANTYIHFPTTNQEEKERYAVYVVPFFLKMKYWSYVFFFNQQLCHIYSYNSKCCRYYFENNDKFKYNGYMKKEYKHNHTYHDVPSLSFNQKL